MNLLVNSIDFIRVFDKTTCRYIKQNTIIGHHLQQSNGGLDEMPVSSDTGRLTPIKMLQSFDFSFQPLAAAKGSWLWPNRCARTTHAPAHGAFDCLSERHQKANQA